MRGRAVVITEAEFHAIVEAAALHEVHYEGDEGSVRSRLVDKALSRVIRKWHEAGERRTKM
jgi:hypothetical protein